MSPRFNFLGDYLAKIIEFSKKTGIAIISKTRRLHGLIREKIISLELQKKSYELLLKKKEIFRNLFNFKGGESAKFYIALILSLTSLANPIPGFLGTIFLFVDP